MELLLLGVVLGVHASRVGRACRRMHVARRSWVVGVGVVVYGHCLLRGVAGVRVRGRHPSRKLGRLAV